MGARARPTVALIGYMAKDYVVLDAESAVRDVVARGRAVRSSPTLPKDAGRRVSEARTVGA